MRHIWKIIIAGGIVLSFSDQVIGQQLLSKEAAVKIALEKNYDIQVAKNNTRSAANNASIYNSGYLPAVTASGGGNYNNRDTEFEFTDGRVISVNNAENKSYNASLALNYTIFDGFGRAYTYKRLKENYNVSEIQVRQVIENAIISLFTGYYQVARLTENADNLEKTLEISQRRRQKAIYDFDFGKGTRLNVLNAEVDVSNDSINLLNIKQQLENAVRDLNITLGQDVEQSFQVDTHVVYATELVREGVLNDALSQNVGMLLAEKNIVLSQHNQKVQRAGWLPRLQANGSYDWNRSNNGVSANQITRQTISGLSAGMTLTWNIFDGGATKTRLQNAKIDIANQSLLKEQQEQQLKRDVFNQWGTYQNALTVLKVRDQNVKTNQQNFKRTKEQYNLGQVTSIEFRQAQINLLNAEMSWNQAKYDAKLAELRLLQLQGKLIGAQY